MFRLCTKSLFLICFKCEILTNPCVNLVLQKSLLSMQVSEDKLQKPKVKYHNNALDVYTDSLILETVSKWKTKEILLTKSKPSNVKPNSIFKSCDDPDHLISYLKQCLSGYCTVNENVLGHFMLTMARHGRINGLMIIEELNNKYSYCIQKAELQMKFAEAYWVNGDLDNMFKTFESFYLIESTKINYVLEPIFYIIVNSRGAASVVMSLKFVKFIANEHEDYRPMSILWKNLFLSDMFSDNLEAEKLMELNSKLFVQVQYIVPVLTRNMLKKHKIDCVQRLMVLLLKLKQMKQYHWMLKSLFDYYCKWFFEFFYYRVV